MRLHLRRIRVVKVLRDDEAELVVEVADAQSVKRCPACGERWRSGWLAYEAFGVLGASAVANPSTSCGLCAIPWVRGPRWRGEAP